MRSPCGLTSLPKSGTTPPPAIRSPSSGPPTAKTRSSAAPSPLTKSVTSRKGPAASPPSSSSNPPSTPTTNPSNSTLTAGLFPSESLFLLNEYQESAEQLSMRARFLRKYRSKRRFGTHLDQPTVQWQSWPPQLNHSSGHLLRTHPRGRTLLAKLSLQCEMASRRSKVRNQILVLQSALQNTPS